VCAEHHPQGAVLLRLVFQTQPRSAVTEGLLDCR